MPPLLAALFMIALDCDLRIVQAIDLGMEWRLDWPGEMSMYGYRFSACECAEAWYANKLGLQRPASHLTVGSFGWPPFDWGSYVV
jgi:hypothetical protein